MSSTATRTSREIPMSSFLKFVDSKGGAKIQAVREALESYRFERDYYGVLRPRLIGMAQTGALKMSDDAEWLEKINAKKVSHYQNRLAAFRRWITKNAPSWVEPPEGAWRSGDLTVRVRPELGLRIEEKSYAVRLHLKTKGISPIGRGATIALMQAALVPQSQWIPAILDVTRGRLVTAGVTENLELLMPAEAAAFVDIWRRIES